LERAGSALPERGSLRPCAWFFGDGAGASAPVLSNRPRWWQLIQECRHSAARPKRFRDPPHRETWSRLAAICDTSHTEMRKVLPAPAPPQSLRNTAAMNQLLVGCSDLPSPIFFSMKSPDTSREVVRCPQKNYLFRGKLDSGYSIYGLSCRRCPRIFDLDLSLGDLVDRLSSNRSNAAVNNMPKRAKTCSHVLT
jgi:hypothetical protein